MDNMQEAELQLDQAEINTSQFEGTEEQTQESIKEPGPHEAESVITGGKRRAKSEKPIRPFPQFSIREAVEIPKIIGAKNAGKPWSSEHVASVLGTSRGNNNFFYLSSASRDCGFTTGTSKAKTIELTALGRKLALPESPSDEELSIIEAFNNIDVFKAVYEFYSGASLPEDKYLCNTLNETFNIDPLYHEDFIKVFKDNLDTIGQSKHSLDASSSNSTAKNGIYSTIWYCSLTPT